MKILIYVKDGNLDKLNGFLLDGDYRKIEWSTSRVWDNDIKVMISYDDYMILKDFE